MNRYLHSLQWGAALALAASGALAQNATPSTSPANPPATLGATPKEAAEAIQKAVPRSDTGTLVRTEPSAADKARAALNDTGANTAAPGATSAGSTAAPAAGRSSMASDPMNRPRVAGTRNARADRN